MAGFWGRYLEGMCAMSEGSLVPDVVGLPWDLAKGLLNEAHIMYNSVIRKVRPLVRNSGLAVIENSLA